jgi:hypothetical protein
MGGKRLLQAVCLVATLCAFRTAPAQSQIISGIVGAGAGTAAGGYLSLSIIVARAQRGHYLHDFGDIFGWTSAPVLVGAATGTALGVWSPPRLWTSVIFGTGGAVVGIPVGMFVGTALSERPEAKWAGGAIGAGVGMTLGFLFGVLSPQEKLVPKPLREAAAVPIGFSIHF